jgi:hypothetical protein
MLLENEIWNYQLAKPFQVRHAYSEPLILNSLIEQKGFASPDETSLQPKSISTTHLYTIVWPIMITHITLKDGGYISYNTQSAWIILARASVPCSRTLNVDLTGGMDKSQKHAREDWDWIIFVVDVC